MEQIIRLTGRIAKVFPANSGVSQRTGNTWMSQEYLFEFFSWSAAQYPDRLVFRVFGEDRIKQFNLQEMEENVTVVLRLGAHENDGRWYNEISATNVIRQGQQQPQDAPTGGGSDQQPSNTPAQAQSAASGEGNAPFPPRVDENGNPKNDANDDLPF